MAAEYGNLQPSDLLKIGHNHGGLGVSVSHSVCGLNQWIGSFSRSVPNKLPRSKKSLLERDRRLFMGDSRAGTHLITGDNCLYPLSA